MGFFNPAGGISSGHIPLNVLNNAASPSAWRSFGDFTLYTTNDNTLGFPHPALMIRTFVFGNSQIMQIASTQSGAQQWRRNGMFNPDVWVGGGIGGWHEI